MNRIERDHPSYLTLPWCIYSTHLSQPRLGTYLPHTISQYNCLASDGASLYDGKIFSYCGGIIHGSVAIADFQELYFHQGMITYVPTEDALDSTLSSDASFTLLGQYYHTGVDVKSVKVQNTVFPPPHVVRDLNRERPVPCTSLGLPPCRRNHHGYPQGVQSPPGMSVGGTGPHRTPYAFPSHFTRNYGAGA